MFKLKISQINAQLLILGSILLLFGFPILIATNLKLHYFVFIIISFAILLTNIEFKINIEKLLYLFFLIIPVLKFALANSIDITFILSLFAYLVLPIIFFTHNFSKFSLTHFRLPFYFFTFICFLGLILQIIGVSSPFLAIDLTYTNGNLSERFGSFAGGPLALGFTASISIFYLTLDLLKSNEQKVKNIIGLSISIFVLLLSQSRRFYIFVTVVVFCMVYFESNLTFNFSRIIKWLSISLLLIVLVIVIASLNSNSNYFLERLISSFDFKNDPSNLLRFVMWTKALNTFFDNFWFGAGLGNLSNVGKDVWASIDSVEDIKAAESYFLKNFVENGIFFGLFFFGFFIKYIAIAFNILKRKSNINSRIACYFLIFFFLDSFFSTSLEAALSSVIFWICMSILQEENKILIGK